MTSFTAEEIDRRILDSYELPNNVLATVQEPVVTVRTITFQHAPYIRECIEGVLMQKTNFAFEYIIGEDCSTDGTREIVFEYAKKYPDLIRVITSDSNVGAKANSHRCQINLRGKYIALCEGDDYWIDPYKLQKQVDILESKPHCSVCAHNVYFMSDGGQKLAWNSPREPEYKLDDQLRRHFVPTCSLMFRADCCLGKERPEWLNDAPGGDVIMVAMSLQYGNLACINDVMACYRKHNGGVYSSRTRAAQRSFALGNRAVLVDNLFGYRPSLIEGMYFYLKSCIFSAVRDGDLHVAREAINKYIKYIWRQQPMILPISMLAYCPKGILVVLLKVRRYLLVMF